MFKSIFSKIVKWIGENLMLLRAWGIGNMAIAVLAGLLMQMAGYPSPIVPLIASLLLGVGVALVLVEPTYRMIMRIGP